MKKTWHDQHPGGTIGIVMLERSFGRANADSVTRGFLEPLEPGATSNDAVARARTSSKELQLLGKRSAFFVEEAGRPATKSGLPKSFSQLICPDLNVQGF